MIDLLGSMMVDTLGLPIRALAVPPITAIVAGTLWLRVPRIRREVAFRGVLIVSVGLAGIETAMLAVMVGVLALFALSGGMEQF